MESITKFSDAINAANKAFKTNFTEELEKFAGEMFAKYPKLNSFGWVQYVPYFNDGDPCQFTIGHAEINEQYCEGEYEADDFDDPEDFEDFENLKEATSEINDLVETLWCCELAIEKLFGSCSRITISRDGGIEVSEYDAPY